MSIIDDCPEPVLAPDAVIVELIGLGICGSDLALWSGRRPTPRLPWIIGHEAVGRVIQSGEAVTDRAAGERVVIEPNYPCGHCHACLTGRTSICPRREIVAINSPGFLRERVAVPAKFAWPAPNEISDEDLICTEPLAVACSALHAAAPAPGERCLVVGAGSQGLLICQLALAHGAAVVVNEPHPGRLDLAHSLGADEDTTPTEEFSSVFETSGSAQGVRTALQRTRAGGTAVLVGIPHGEVPLSVAAIVRRQIRVVGSLIYDHPVGFRETIELLTAARVAPSQILRARFALTDAPRALATASEISGKSWIAFGNPV